LLLGWTEFYAGSDADHAPARICGKISKDGGRTWGEKLTLVENDGGCNVMEVNFIRLKSGGLALLYCKKNIEDKDISVMMRVSADEGRTWGAAKQFSPNGRYTGLTNGRCIRLRSGRILLEAWEGGDSFCFLSDDDGANWREGGRIKPGNGECWEPVCIERKDGTVMMLMRTMLGGQYKSVSKDGGETWGEAVASPLTGSGSPAYVTRVPGTGDMVAVWNNDLRRAVSRTPLTAAISTDEGETWSHLRNIEEIPGDRWAYPAITWIGNEALLTYFSYTGGISLHLRRVPEAWFYGK